MSTKPKSIRLTEPQWRAIDDAARADRKQTGNATTASDLIREAARRAVSDRGVPWPE